MAKKKVGQAAISKVKPDIDMKRSDAGNNKKGRDKGNGKDKIMRKKRKRGRRKEKEGEQTRSR